MVASFPFLCLASPSKYASVTCWWPFSRAVSGQTAVSKSISSAQNWLRVDTGVRGKEVHGFHWRHRVPRIRGIGHDPHKGHLREQASSPSRSHCAQTSFARAGGFRGQATTVRSGRLRRATRLSLLLRIQVTDFLRRHPRRFRRQIEHQETVHLFGGPRHGQGTLHEVAHLPLPESASGFRHSASLGAIRHHPEKVLFS